MIADRDIVCVAGVAWDSYRLSLHQYMSRLARAHRVLFVNRPVALPRAIARRERRGATDRAIAHGSVRRVGERLYVADPPAALPLRFERPVTVANQVLRGSFVARAARDLGFAPPSGSTTSTRHESCSGSTHGSRSIGSQTIIRPDPRSELIALTGSRRCVSRARASPLGRSGAHDRC